MVFVDFNCLNKNSALQWDSTGWEMKEERDDTTVQKCVRLPEWMLEQIDALPARYGLSTAAKIKTLLMIGLERIEKEQLIIEATEKRETS